MTPDQMIELAEKQAREVLIGGKAELMSHLLLEGPKGEIVIIGNTPPGLIAHLVKGSGAKAYSILSECWMAVQPKGWKPSDPVGVPAHDRPDRVEAVVGFASDGRDERSIALKIIRDQDGNCVALEKLPHAEVGGRFADILRVRH